MARQRLWPALAVVVLGLTAPLATGQAPAPTRLSFGNSETTSPATPGPGLAPALPEPPALPKLSGVSVIEAPTTDRAETEHVDPEVVQAGCVGCNNGGGILGLRNPEIFPNCNCGAGGHCIPGRDACSPCCHDGLIGRFLCGLYDCICCPDPCYEPRWIPVADAAFFCEAVRPITQTRIRWDSGVNLILPDRAEYFWAQANGTGKGPKPVAPYLGELSLKYNDLDLYTEVASGKFSFFFEMPYRSLDPTNAPHAAGFADMNLGTKTLLFDCELLQVAMIFRTYLPMGNFTKGLGVGHVSLEPSLLAGLRIARDTYLQTQIAEWIPLGGDPGYAGSILHYHASLNQVLARILPDVPLLGTLEMSGYSFQTGSYTDPYLGGYQKAGDYTYFYLGSGLRLVICDRMDLGFGVNLALTDQHFASQLYRTEFRIRY